MSNFKTCSLCSKEWSSLEELLEDSAMDFGGYQAFPRHPERSLLLFTHKADKCGTTFSFKIDTFTKFARKPIKFSEFEFGKELDCEGHCLDTNNLSPCHSKNCPGRELRDLLQVVKSKMKADEAA